MQAMKTVVSAAALAVGALTLAPTEAQAQECYTSTSVYLASGYTPVEYSRDNQVTWHPAYTVTPWFTYSVIPGTSYINYQSTPTGPAQTWTHFRTGFTVPPPPPGARVFNRRLNLEVHADNVAKVYLDNNLFYEQAWTAQEFNFQDPPETDSTPITDGYHVLRFELYNFDEQTALDFRVTVEETICEPCDPFQRVCEAEPL